MTAEPDTNVVDYVNAVRQRRTSYGPPESYNGSPYTVGSSSTFTFDATGRETLSDSISDTLNQWTSENNVSHATAPHKETQTAKTYDADNHTRTIHAIVSGRDRVQNGATTTTDRGAITIGWGPNGHPVQVLNYHAAPPAVPDYQFGPLFPSLTLHWDGDTLLFVTDASGNVVSFKVGLDGETAPGNTNGMFVYDRDTAGVLLMTSNATGHGGITPLDPSDLTGPTLPSSNGYSANTPLGFGLFSYTRGDGFDIGPIRISGVRAFNPELGSWTTPDAYEGEIHDPASQRRYMWNRNNPYDYSDPSGYDPCIGALCLPTSTIPVVLAGAGCTVTAIASRVLPGAAVIVIVLTPAAIADDTQSGYEKEHPTLKPGPHAGTGVPGTKGKRPTAKQQREINDEGERLGCHTGGCTDPGTKSGKWVGDHQPPSALNPGEDSTLYPQCLGHSCQQGGVVRGLVKGGSSN